MLVAVGALECQALDLVRGLDLRAVDIGGAAVDRRGTGEGCTAARVRGATQQSDLNVPELVVKRRDIDPQGMAEPIGFRTDLVGGQCFGSEGLNLGRNERSG